MIEKIERLLPHILQKEKPPAGYVWTTLKGTSAKFLMPKTWHYIFRPENLLTREKIETRDLLGAELIPGTTGLTPTFVISEHTKSAPRGQLFTEEDLRETLTRTDSSQGSKGKQITGKNRPFITGLAVSILKHPQIKEAGDAITHYTSKSAPIEPIVNIDDSCFTRRRGLFRFNPKELVELENQELTPSFIWTTPSSATLYIDIAVNRKTSTLHVIIFGSLPDEWEQNEPIAKTMIEKSILDKKI